MAHIYAEFDSTPTTLIADLKAKILTSSDYSNPTGQVVRATTPLGATIALDLQGIGAPDAQRMRPYYYRSFPGTGPGVDLLQQSLYWKYNGGGSTSMPIHCKVAAGPTLLYIELEGPRAAELSPDSATQGSLRQCIFVSQLTPYFAGDSVPAVVVGGPTSTPGNPTGAETASAGGSGAQLAYVSRNQANTTSWVPATLASLVTPVSGGTGNQFSYTPGASDGNTYLLPYVVFEQAAGIRGRLTDMFFAGWNPTPNYAANSGDASNGFRPGDVVTYGGNTYKITAPYRSATTTYSYGSLGMVTNATNGQYQSSPLVAVRTA